MTSYLRSWWFGTATGTTAHEDSKGSPSVLSSSSPSIASFDPSTSAPDVVAQHPAAMSVTISTPEETQEAIDDAKDEADDVEDDIPPAFPGLNSIQRSTAPSEPQRPRRSDNELMSPPAFPITVEPALEDTSSSPYKLSPKPTGTGNTSSLLPPASSSTFLIPPMPRTSSNTLKLPPSTTRAPTAPSKRREKVALAPGHSPLDWAALKTSGRDLRGTPGLMRITPSQLKAHNKRDDAWSAFNGKVYNVTPYLSFHPGGEKELMRVVGRDGTKLFALTHAWVNADFMLDECMVGFLVPEPSSAA